jgi:hypothetical protein
VNVDGAGELNDSKTMSEFVAYTTGDVKEAVERTQEAEARVREATIKRFRGDRIAAEQYMTMKKKRRKHLYGVN